MIPPQDHQKVGRHYLILNTIDASPRRAFLDEFEVIFSCFHRICQDSEVGFHYGNKQGSLHLMAYGLPVTSLPKIDKKRII